MTKYQCVFIIVSRGNGEEVIKASKTKGAKGGTIIHGRGSSVRETRKLFGTLIEPEKDIVMIVVEKERVDAIILAIKESINIDAPGMGILFVIDVERVEGLIES